jgi:hypothetical protein
MPSDNKSEVKKRFILCYYQSGSAFVDLSLPTALYISG